MSSHVAIWIIAAVATAGVVIRPFGWPEAVWAVGGAVLLVASGLVSPANALTGVGKGADVYLFLTGMMLLSEVARQEGLFDWLAAQAVRRARGSAPRLFLLLYGVGTIVTIFLSNDATAVVLTPAVAAAARAAKAEQPLPFLLICAMIANAASFVLPISNPANLVLYGGHTPALADWLPRFLAPSAVSIVATYAVLRWTQREALRQPIAGRVDVPALSRAGAVAAFGIAATAALLTIASALDVALGVPTMVAGLVTTGLVLAVKRKAPWPLLKAISWSVLPLVAGLFVLVEALDLTGATRALGALMGEAARGSPTAVALGAGVITALAANLANNLPVGLIAASAVHAARATDALTSAVLIGVDLGPNLSVTGSLATLLWLNALRREGVSVSAIAFLKIGALVMPAALLLSLAAAWLRP